ncbi:MAG: molybdopterin biosynthesis protein [Thermodesulfovibrionales bacterium]
MKRDIYYQTTPLGEAAGKWFSRLAALKALAPLGAETVPVADSLGRVTAAPVTARISSPFYHSSAMDGYAVRFTDTFGASETSPKRLRIGQQAFYVDTGDPLPEGTNAVVMVEDVNVLDGEIEILAPLTPWKSVRTIGEDIVATELILPENHRIRPVDMGAMLAGGHTSVLVRRRPRVALIPTGTEIVEPGSELRRGSIIEFNSRVLAGYVTQWGGEPLRMEIVPDDPDLLRKAVSEALGKADLVVINAGASAGSEDFTAQVVAELGEVVVHGLGIKPGKPAILGVAEGKPVLGAPGYPVSAYLIFGLFARPLVMKWQGLEPEPPERVRAKLSRQVASSLGQEEFLRMKVGKVGGAFIATPLGRGAGLLMTMVRADGVMSVPAMSEGLAAGAEVEIELVRSRAEIENTIVSIGSHDNAMDVLANSLRKRHPRFSLSSAHVGSMGGLVALKKGEAHVAPTHLLDEETGDYNVPFIRKLLPDRKVALLNLVHRQQGLMVPRGNPKGIRGFEDLAREDVTYINRQRGAGTRLLLDKHLRELGISPAAVKGYDREEYTHMAVASAVLTGVADTGLGVLSAANALELDFIPVARERYDLAIPAEYLETEMLKALLEVIREGAEFKAAVSALGGYDVSDMGKVMWEGP